MSKLRLDVESVAESWAMKMVQAMGNTGMSETQLRDHVTVIRKLVVIASRLVNDDPVLRLPEKPETVNMTLEHANLVLDLFVRGINQSIRRMEQQGLNAQERNTLLERCAWEVYNMAKVMVALMVMPQPQTRHMLQDEKQLRMMLRPGVDELLNRLLGRPNLNASHRREG